MKRQNLYLIPLGMFAAIIQLVFFWLSPEVPCYWIVYAVGTFMTLIHLGIVFLVGTNYGVRRSAATVVAGSICYAVIVMVCGGLLAAASSIRNAVFALAISSMVYAVVVFLLILFVESPGNGPVHPEVAGNMGEPKIPITQVPMPMVKSEDCFMGNQHSGAVTPPPLPTRRS